MFSETLSWQAWELVALVAIVVSFVGCCVYLDDAMEEHEKEADKALEKQWARTRGAKAGGTKKHV